MLTQIDQYVLFALADEVVRYANIVIRFAIEGSVVARYPRRVIADLIVGKLYIGDIVAEHTALCPPEGGKALDIVPSTEIVELEDAMAEVVHRIEILGRDYDVHSIFP